MVVVRPEKICLFMLRLFRSCALIEVVDGKSDRRPSATGERFKDRLLMSAFESDSIVDRRRAIVGQTFAAACAALKLVNDTAAHASIVIASGQSGSLADAAQSETTACGSARTAAYASKPPYRMNSVQGIRDC